MLLKTMAVIVRCALAKSAPSLSFPRRRTPLPEAGPPPVRGRQQERESHHFRWASGPWGTRDDSAITLFPQPLQPGTCRPQGQRYLARRAAGGVEVIHVPSSCILAGTFGGPPSRGCRRPSPARDSPTASSHRQSTDCGLRMGIGKAAHLGTQAGATFGI